MTTSALGTDFTATATDMDPRMLLVSGTANLGLALARRLTTPLGGLWYAPNYGYDVRNLLGSDLDDAGIAAAQARIEAQCEMDERVLAVSCAISWATDEELQIAIYGETADGPFRLILAVTDVTVELLTPEASA